MTAIRIAAMVAIAMFSAACQTASARQPAAQASVVAAIKAEGTGRSQAPQLFHTLTDAIGPRLSGSPAHRAAAGWAADRFREWGLANARLEPFQFGRGWTLEKLAAEMTMPRYMPLLAYAEAWSPATLGAVTGTPIYVGDSTVEEIDRLGARLRGAIVLAYRPQSEFLRADRMEPSLGSPVKTGNPRTRMHRARHPRRSSWRVFARTGPVWRCGPARWSTAPCASRAIAPPPPTPCRPWFSPRSSTTCSCGWRRQGRRCNFGWSSACASSPAPRATT
jgi:hypothetical protein